MKELITKAITKRIVIQFEYDGFTRIVEPFALGIHETTKNTVLRCYQIGGYFESKKTIPWRLYDVYLMNSLQLVKKEASSSREYYNPKDKDMSFVICCV
jgi:hypothetical protein|tara:strand:- start:628 stop:924 length:297 start_codon:yes stop_codon:yes gene_type:complete